MTTIIQLNQPVPVLLLKKQRTEAVEQVLHVLTLLLKTMIDDNNYRSIDDRRIDRYKQTAEVAEQVLHVLSS